MSINSPALMRATNFVVLEAFLLLWLARGPSTLGGLSCSCSSLSAGPVHWLQFSQGRSALSFQWG